MKICIVNQGILGDMLTRTPVIREIRRIYPEATITCIVDPIGKETLDGSPDIDNFFVVNRSKSNYRKYLLGKVKLYLYALTNRFDIAMDLYGGTSSRQFLKLVRADKKVIVSNDRAKVTGMPALTENLDYPNPHHLSVVSQQVLKYFPQENLSLDTRPRVDLASKNMPADEAEYITTNIKTDLDKMFIVSLGAGDIKKIPDTEQIVRLIEYCHKKYHLIPLILRNPGQEYLQDDLIDALKDNQIPFTAVKVLSVPAIVHLLQKVRFVIVPDTGVYHLAVATRTPILGIFVYTPPEEVRPSCGSYINCYKEGAERRPYGERGLVYAEANLDDDYLKNCLDKLMTDIDH
jgi:ADP-heptose:LPS heptosyltransferase